MTPCYIVDSKLSGEETSRKITDVEDVKRYIHRRMLEGADVSVYAVVQVLKFAPGKQWKLAPDDARKQLEILVTSQVKDPPAFR